MMGGVDLRQVVAGILTITMFVMLGNMIRRDHFDSHHEQLLGLLDRTHYEDRTSEQDLISISSKKSTKEGPWKEDQEEEQQLRPCWEKPHSAEVGNSKGSITLTLINGPEYHVSQIAAAVVVAKYLGATLVIPDIRGTNPVVGADIRSSREGRKSFGAIYDIHKFIRSLDGVITVAQQPFDENSTEEVVKVPSRVTRDYIVDHVEPIFRRRKNIRLVPSLNMRMKIKKKEKEFKWLECLVMFGGTLELQPEVREVVDTVVERLRTLSRKSDGRFVAVDLRLKMLKKNHYCQVGVGVGIGRLQKKCLLSAVEIAQFLRKVGFPRDTTIYLTQTKWDISLDPLKEDFPNVYTKENIMPIDKKANILEDMELEKVIDYYLCSESDVFVPGDISGLFYTNVVGRRIAHGRTHILLPPPISSSLTATDSYLSPYVTKKNHFAYSCYC